jgi:hypothetical protein
MRFFLPGDRDFPIRWLQLLSSPSRAPVRRAKRFRRTPASIVGWLAVALGAFTLASCGHGEPVEPQDLVEVSTITIDTTAFNIERGTSATVRATV